MTYPSPLPNCNDSRPGWGTDDSCWFAVIFGLLTIVALCCA